LHNSSRHGRRHPLTQILQTPQQPQPSPWSTWLANRRQPVPSHPLRKPFFKYVNEDLRPKYGPIFTLKMGTRTLIIVSDATLAHEALIEKGAIFATRPAENPTRSIFSCRKFTVNASLYGPVWRSLRRNMVQNMLASARIKEFRNLRESAMDSLVDRIRVEAAENRGSVWVLRNARFAVFKILLAMCFGFEMDEPTVEKIDRVMKSVLIVLDPRIDDFLPVLSLFFRTQRNRVAQVRKEQVDAIVPLIERRRRALINGVNSDDPKTLSFSYLDTLFDLQVEGRKSGPSDFELVSLISEFLNGGTDTTATAVEWGMAELIANRHVQDKLYREITAVAGKRKIEEKDLESMPYLQAVVKELLRKHPPTYFALTHAVVEETTLGGYDIPTDAGVEVYLPGIGNDPKIWVEPERFDPERFAMGKEEADITGVREVKMMPFGVGRRICPGLGLATVHLELMIGRMVQEFEWSVFPARSEVDFEEKFEFTVVMKNTLRAVIKPRVST
ncbi:Cytochrome P450 77A3, partial [Linum perenne]